jgi:hypothetical protein
LNQKFEKFFWFALNYALDHFAKVTAEDRIDLQRRSLEESLKSVNQREILDFSHGF